MELPDRPVRQLGRLALYVMCIALIGAIYATDPDGWATSTVRMMGLGAGLLAVAAAQIGRKLLFGYPEADMRSLFRRARESSVGAGLALVALALIINGMLGVFGPRATAAPIDARSYVPANATQHLPTLRAEQAAHWPDHPAPVLLAGLIEQESCISLTHSRCWSPTSRLKSAREEGAGLGQITRAWRSDGSLRFDAMAEQRAAHRELAELSWANVYQRPDLQLRTIVLMSRELYRTAARVVPATMPALQMADAAYNGGWGGVQSDRRACQIKPGCDPSQWFGHVERTCTKSRAPLYGSRSACDINREHVEMVFRVRSVKYAPLMGLV
jgi:hypothetical protein